MKRTPRSTSRRASRQLRAKLETAVVVFPDDLPRDVASLGSQIAYAVGEETHVATLTGTTGLDRRWLPITLPFGLALLGQLDREIRQIDVIAALCRDLRDACAHLTCPDDCDLAHVPNPRDDVMQRSLSGRLRRGNGFGTSI